MKTLFAAAMAAAALYAGSANAITYSYRMVGRQIFVNATGEIMPNEIDLFTRWGLSLPAGASPYYHREVCFRFARRQRFGRQRPRAPDRTRTAAPTGRRLRHGCRCGGMCASACVLLWAAGVHKSVAPHFQGGRAYDVTER